MFVVDTSRNTKPSDSSADVDVTVSQKFTKMGLDGAVAPEAPPRPPKPPQLAVGHNYFNLMPAPAARNKANAGAESDSAAEPKVKEKSWRAGDLVTGWIFAGDHG